MVSYGLRRTSVVGPQPKPRNFPGILFCLCLLLVLLAGCATSGNEPSLEERAQRIDRQLMCPICAGQTLDQSASTLAAQMQAVVRAKLRAGWTEGQILRFFVDRYGEVVLAAPPQRGFNLVAWIAPPVGALAGLLLLVLSVRGMRRKPEASREGPTEAARELEPYLTLVDRELGEHLSPASPASRETKESGGLSRKKETAEGV